jgi:carboxyl-terminal processing protease
VYSLNIDKFKVAQAEIEEKAKKYKPLVNYKSTLSFLLYHEMEAMSKDASLKEKRAGMRLCQKIFIWRKQ